MERKNNRLLAALCAVPFLAIACAQPGSGAEAPGATAEVGRVFLVGVDGATWRVMDPMIERGKLPNFAQLAGAGCRGSLTSDPISRSPRIWTSIATGVRPETHGVLDFVRERKVEGKRHLVNSEDVAVPRVWDIVSAAGLEAGVTNYWATYPVNPIRGFMVSDHTIPARSQARIDFFTEGESPPPDRYGLLHPPDFWEKVGPILREMPFDKENAPDDPFALQLLSLYYEFANDRQALEMALAGLDAYGPRLNVLYFSGPDPVSHKYWRYYEPDHAAFKDDRPEPLDVAVFGDIIPWLYRHVDAMIGEIRARLKPEDLLLIISDHGFQAGLGKRGTSGRHETDGIYVAAGGPVAPPCPEAISLYDVTPTLLYLLDLPVPDYVEGRAATRLVTPSFLAAHPVRTTDETAKVERLEASDELDAIEAERLEKLKALGYLD